ncbi:MAG: type I-MYXAN CRISPR-associated endonuclease Cas1, partial [Myxococcales bacterium]|nr:type I-MYXAN CRISPR-associated endonuclease Cas1 [Myxococcales bacterium]
LEEVEELRVADASVWAGRTLHEELGEPADVVSLTMESARLGLRGRVDAIRRRDGQLHLVEHKRGRSCRGEDGGAEAWASDRVQAVAYAMLLEEHANQPVPEVRIRYHRDNKTVRVPVTEATRAEVAAALARARVLRRSTERPPITPRENLCVKCSLAPVCLPEEARLAHALAEPEAPPETPAPLRLFPPDSERRSLHVMKHGARVGRSSGQFAVAERGEKPTLIGAREVSDVVIHGHAQITTQALRMCADEQIPVHFMGHSGAYIGAFRGGSGNVQRRLRQFRGLDDDAFALTIARRLIAAKIELQLRHVLRSSRKDEDTRARVDGSIESIRACLRGLAQAESREAIMGHEGNAARAYFAALAELVTGGEALRPSGRSRRPPTDRFNALLSFGYGLLYRDILGAILCVGLDPAFGVLHQPRSTAFPLALDLMELFRVPVVDMAVLGAINRRTFTLDEDFAVTPSKVWLTETGRTKAVEAYERRKHEEYRHPVIGYTLSYARMMELETRLLEKEWSGEPGLFARLRIR